MSQMKDFAIDLEQHLADMAVYLPSDRREAIHAMAAPCSAAEYIEAYAARYGWDDLEQTAERVSRDASEAVSAFAAWLWADKLVRATRVRW